MKPWDPIITEIPGKGLPVASPIRLVLVGDEETQWWAHLLAALCGLRTIYQRVLLDKPQADRTGRIHDLALESIARIYLGDAETIRRSSVLSSSSRVLAWGRHDPLALEIGWWAQAAACAHALASGYAFSLDADDARAVLSCDVLRQIRARIECALPEEIAHELLHLSTGAGWLGSKTARVIEASRGTEPDEHPQTTPQQER